MALTSYLRLVKTGWVLTREGVTRLTDTLDLPPSARAAIKVLRPLEKRSVQKSGNAERLTQALNRLGPTYIKIGQFLATRPDIVGAEIAKDLSLLQDKLPPFSMEEAKATLQEELGADVETLFSSFSEPIAAASIAQVHKATIPQADGSIKTVAIKILRPNVRKRFANDLSALMTAATWVQRLSKPARRMRPVAAVETQIRSAELELDLRLEAAALSELADNTEHDKNFKTPQIHWETTTKSILTTEWIDAVKLSDRDAVTACGVDKKKLAVSLMQSFLSQAVRDGFFHADLHQGNLFVEPEGTLIAIDGGIMGRIGKAESRFFAHILWGFIERDYQGIAQVHFDAGYVPARHKVEDFAQALRAIGEPIQGLDADQISMARLLQQLLEVTDLFDMPLQPQLIFLQRTMVVAEGVARDLDPDFNMWVAAEPVLKDWMAKNVGPISHAVKLVDSVSALGKLAGELPTLAARAEQLSADFAVMGQEGFRLDKASIEAIGRAEARQSAWRTAALWVIAIALSAIAIPLIM